SQSVHRTPPLFAPQGSLPPSRRLSGPCDSLDTIVASLIEARLDRGSMDHDSMIHRTDERVVERKSSGVWSRKQRLVDSPIIGIRNKTRCERAPDNARDRSGSRGRRT